MDIATRLLLGKDILFIFIVDLSYKIFPTEDYWPPLLMMASISGIAKYFTFAHFDKNSVILWSFYIIFLSPTLEFSAYRASMGIALLGLFLLFSQNKARSFLFMISSTIAHFSLLPTLVCFLLSKKHINIIFSIFLYLIICFLVIFLGPYFLSFQRGESYENNLPTFYGYFFTMALLVTFVLLIINKRKIDFIFLNLLVFSALSFGSIFISVGISHRMVEISNFILLLIFFKIGFARIFSNLNYLTAAVIFIISISTRMVLNGAWMSMKIF
jgi:hypothetical protein